MTAEVMTLVLMLLMPGIPYPASAGVEAANSPSISTPDLPIRAIPDPLRKAWLRFHEEQWCLGIDAVFVFHAHGMEAWCRINSERNYQSFSALLQPLKKSFSIDLYPTFPEKNKKPWSPEDDDPPPSLWNNAELRIYMRDPLMSRLGAFDDWPGSMADEPGAMNGLKRRMKLFGDQIIEWAQKMKQLADDLPALAEAAYNPAEAAHNPKEASDLRKLASEVCLTHARETSKYADRLLSELGHAFPRGAGDSVSAASLSSEMPSTAATPYDRALQISEQVRVLAAGITRFLYPQAYTVSLGDLRGSQLLASLKRVRQDIAAFERLASKERLPAGRKIANLNSPPSR